MKIKLIALLLLIITARSAWAQIPALERVEPMFWWVGMKNPKLQLLVHGEDIAACTVKLTYPGVKLVRVNKVENPNYLFLDLEIAPAAKPGAFNITFIKAGAENVHYRYELKQRDNSPNRAQGVTNKDIIYLLMPDRFSNGDTTNDSKPGMLETAVNRDSMYYRHGGDIQGIMNHLDYLKDLGITAIWLTPEITNDMPHASYHGYAVTDHYKVDPRFGSNALYKAFVDKCHAMGLKVIKDLVHNHSGTQDYLVKDMPMKSWVHQWPKFTRTNYADQTLMDPYGSKVDKEIMLDGWFDHSMADMNEDNPYVQNYLTQNHIWWVEYAGVDGFRLDTYPYNDPVYMAKWAVAVRAEFPHLSIFGETNASNINNAFYAQGDKINRGLNTHLPGLTDVELEGAIYDALNGNSYSIYNMLAQDFMYEDPSQNVVFFDNHDQSRFYSVIDEDFNKYKAGIALLLTTRRIPQLYYGDEILMTGKSAPDGLVRKDFPGGWPGDKVNKFTAAGRTEKENEAFNYVRTLANYRKNTTALQTGKLMQYVPQDGTYVYFRYDAQKTVMIAYNSTADAKILKTDRFNERMAGFNSAVNIVSGERIDITKSIQVPGKTTLVLELKN